MKPVPVSEFARQCGGHVSDLDANECILGFALDSREVSPGDLFLAIKGERSDGHDFLADVFQRGAVAALVEKPKPGPTILVQDLVEALAQFGRARRDQFSGVVIGVTGSNGKTTTKELTAAALTPLGEVLKSPANKNTEYTSPLVWAEAEDQASAVIEMAMRGSSQIAHLASIAKPSIGIVTVIGTAHIEKVGNREGIMKAKAELLEALPTNGTGIVWREDDFWSELNELCSAKVRSFGFSQEAECRITGYRTLDWDSCVVRLQLDGQTVEAKLPTIGRHQAQNAAASVLAAHTAGVGVQQAADCLSLATLPPMRLQTVELNGAKILLDTYNASPDSTVAALVALSEVPCKGQRFAVLGEMKELGDFTESGHRMVGKALVGSSIEKVFLTGGPTSFIADEAMMAGFPSAQLVSDRELNISHVRDFLRGLKEGDVVLIKGSRALGLEAALEGLD